MKMFIDTEFNGFGGELISMAIVSEDGAEFYEVLECNDPMPWVAEHVIPILNKDSIPEYLFKEKLRAFLNWYSEVHIIADWPDDIKYFCQQIMAGPGLMHSMPKMTFSIERGLSSKDSVIPHNALADARSILIDYNNRYYE